MQRLDGSQLPNQTGNQTQRRAKRTDNDTSGLYKSNATVFVERKMADNLFSAFPEIRFNSLDTSTQECKRVLEGLKRRGGILGQIPPTCEPPEYKGNVRVEIPFGHTLYAKTIAEIRDVLGPYRPEWLKKLE